MILGKHRLGKKKNPPLRPEELAEQERQKEDEEKDKEEDIMDNKETENTETDKKTTAPKGLPAHIRKAVVMRKFAARVRATVLGEENKKSTGMDKWVTNPIIDDARKDALQAVELLVSAATALDSLGVEFAPKSGGKRVFTAGVAIRIKEAVRSRYIGLTGDGFDNITVHEQDGNRIIGITESGVRFLAPRAHVELITTTE